MAKQQIKWSPVNAYNQIPIEVAVSEHFGESKKYNVVDLFL